MINKLQYILGSAIDVNDNLNHVITTSENVQENADEFIENATAVKKQNFIQLVKARAAWLFIFVLLIIVIIFVCIALRNRK